MSTRTHFCHYTLNEQTGRWTWTRSAAASAQRERFRMSTFVLSADRLILEEKADGDLSLGEFVEITAGAI